MKIQGLLVFTCLVLPPSWCAPFRDEDHEVPDEMELPEGLHNHSDPYRDGRLFQNNKFVLGDIDVSGQVEGQDISIGSRVDIDVDSSNSEDLENPGQVKEDEASIDSQTSFDVEAAKSISLSTEEKSSELPGILTENGNPCPDLTDSPALMPKGPQGPAGATLHYDLLSNSQAGLNYPDGKHLGAFVAETMDSPPNEEKQVYIPRAASQDPGTNEITITAEKYEENGSPKITSASLSTRGVWTTAQSPEIKNRGYLEVRALMPANLNPGNFSGSFPAIRLLGADGQEWPDCGEIEIAKLKNGEPTVHMALHSTNNHGVNEQHPPNSPVHLETDMSKIPVIFGLQWHIKADDGQIDLSWYITSFDFPSNVWYLKTITKSLLKSNGNADDFPLFSKSFSGNGYYLVINLAQGGHFTKVNQESVLLVDGPQRIVIESAKVYRLSDEAINIQDRELRNFGIRGLGLESQSGESKSESWCAVYEHCNYGGRFLNLSSGEGISSLWQHGFNDVGSAVRIQPGCKLEVWEHDNYQGIKGYARNDMNCLGRRWNDFISSVRCTCTSLAGSEENPTEYISQMISNNLGGIFRITLDSCFGRDSDSDWHHCCTSSLPCPENHGDCDNDSHCAGDLVCGKDNCRSINGMGSHSQADCCVKSKGTVEVRFSTENNAGSPGDHYLTIRQGGRSCIIDLITDESDGSYVDDIKDPIKRCQSSCKTDFNYLISDRKVKEIKECLRSSLRSCTIRVFERIYKIFDFITSGPSAGDIVEKDICMKLDMDKCVELRFENDHHDASQVYRVTFEQDGRVLDLEYDTKGGQGWFHSGNIRWNTAC